MLNPGNTEEKGNTAEIDLDAFDEQIDKEIDKLFTHPSENAGGAPGRGTLGLNDAPPLSSGEVPPPRPFRPDSPSVELKSDPRAATAVPRPQPMAKPAEVFVLASEKPDQDEAVPVPGAVSGEQELGGFLEALSVAYLSLEWEISRENLVQLELALEKVEPYCNRGPEAAALMKILKSLLQRLRARSSSTTPRVTEMVRDSYMLLRRILQNSSKATVQDRKELNGLIARLRSLKEQSAAAVEKQGWESPPAPRVSADDSAVLSPSVLSSVPKEVPVPAHGDLKTWLGGYWEEANAYMARAEEDAKRLAKIVEILDKVPALKAVSSHMARIRINLEKQVLFQKEKNWEWVTQMERLLAPAERTPPVATQKSNGGEDLVSREASPAATQTPKAPGETEEGSRTVGEEQEFCVFRIGGQPFAVPASGLVKYRKVSSRQAKKILERGRATLGDFKDFWGNIRKGLVGSWKELPAKTLKNRCFLPIPRDRLGTVGDPVGTSVLLLSNGTEHGLLLVDSTGVEMRKEEIRPVPGPEGRLGLIGLEAREAVEVLDVDWVLKAVRIE